MEKENLDGKIKEMAERIRELREIEGLSAADYPFPALYRLTADILTFPEIVQAIDRILDKFGRIKDSASEELLRIRKELSRLQGSISHTLNSILRSAQSEGLVEKDITPTVRDGRLVIPVSPGLKRRISGIVKCRRGYSRVRGGGFSRTSFPLSAAFSAQAANLPRK